MSSENSEIERKAIAWDELRKWRENNPGKPIGRENFRACLRRADRQLSTGNQQHGGSDHV